MSTDQCEHRLRRHLEEYQRIMAQLSSHHFESDRQFILLNRADHFAMWIARTSPANRKEALVMAELIHDLAGTPTIRRAAGQLVIAIERLWKE